MKNKFDIKEYLPHILLLIAGAMIMIGGCFQNSLWFDEAYTVGMMSHSLFEGMKWATFDVHPHLYYVGLKLFTMVFGNSLYTMRIFSAIGGILFASLGLTHIRKDFGKEIGFWFSFCAVFSASTLAYALQIRMYTWGAYFVTLAGIYAFRMYRNPASNRDRILFCIFSVASAYTHYFALFAVCAINIVLLYQNLKDKNPMKLWWQNAAIQIGLYLPGAVVFLLQALQEGGSWRSVKFPNVIFDLVSYHWLGDTVEGIFKDGSLWFYMIGLLFLGVYAFGGWKLYKYCKSNKAKPKEKSAVNAALKVYFGVILFTLAVSIFKVIYYIRYTVVIGGFLFFMMAVLIASISKKTLKTIVAILIIAVFAVQSAGIYKTLYDPSADSIELILDDKIQNQDDFLFEGIDGFVITVRYPQSNCYFYNSGKWGVHKAYRAMGEKTFVLDEIQDFEFNNRVWTLGRGACYETLIAKGYREIEEHYISLVYHQYNFQLILLEKQ